MGKMLVMSAILSDFISKVIFIILPHIKETVVSKDVFFLFFFSRKLSENSINRIETEQSVETIHDVGF